MNEEEYVIVEVLSKELPNTDVIWYPEEHTIEIIDLFTGTHVVTIEVCDDGYIVTGKVNDVYDFGTEHKLARLLNRVLVEMMVE